MHVDIRVLIDDEATVVEPHGDIDISNQRAFADVVVPLSQTAGRYVLDLTQVGFIDSSGIGVLARLRAELRNRGLPLHVVPSPRVHAALKLAALTGVIGLHSSVQAARLAQNDHPQ